MLKMVPTAGDILQIQDASGCEQTWVVFHQRCPSKLPLHTLLFIHLIDNSLIHTSKRPDAYHIISYMSRNPYPDLLVCPIPPQQRGGLDCISKAQLRAKASEKKRQERERKKGNPIHGHKLHSCILYIVR